MIILHDTDGLVSIEDDTLRCEWYNADEGRCGDFNPGDPNDTNLLRFDVYAKNPDGEWEAVDDASYCTNMAADTDPAILEKALQYIFKEYRDAIGSWPYNSVKKLGEQLSWISSSDFESEIPA